MTRSLLHKLGICQWFHFETYGEVMRAAAEMRALGVSRLRTGISWADYHRTSGPAWYDWLFEALEGFELLVSIWHTRPSISARYTCASPPERVTDYGSFVGLMIERYGHRFWDVELWNEPGSLHERDLRQREAGLSRLGERIAVAAEVARSKGKRTVLGGVTPTDHQWLELMRRQGVLAHVDVIAVREIPGMASEISSDTPPNIYPDATPPNIYPDATPIPASRTAPGRDRQIRWPGWEQKIARIREHGDGKPIWITAIGLATWDAHAERLGRYRLQAELLRSAAQAPVERVYWHSLIDLDPGHDAAEGFHVDENEYHLGLVSWEGDRKPAWGIMKHLLAEERAPLLAPPDPAGALTGPLA